MSPEVELDLELLKETPAAFIVYNGTKDVWLGKTYCRLDSDTGNFFVAEWLALEEGLI